MCFDLSTSESSFKELIDKTMLVYDARYENKGGSSHSDSSINGWRYFTPDVTPEPAYSKPENILVRAYLQENFRRILSLSEQGKDMLQVLSRQDPTLESDFGQLRVLINDAFVASEFCSKNYIESVCEALEKAVTQLEIRMSNARETDKLVMAARYVHLLDDAISLAEKS